MNIYKTIIPESKGIIPPTYHRNRKKARKAGVAVKRETKLQYEIQKIELSTQPTLTEVVALLDAEAKSNM